MANKRIIDLAGAAAVATTDLFELDTGAVSLRATGAQIAAMVKTVAPAIVQNAGVAFGVQQNNTTGKTLLVVAILSISWDALNPGAYSMTIVTNSTSPNPMAQMFADFGGDTFSPSIVTTHSVLVAPGGWYQINNTSDPGGGNAIVSVWECAL